MFMASQIQGEGSIFLVSKKNLNPYYWHIWGIRNCQKWNRIEKIMPTPKVEGVKKLKKQTPKRYKG